MRKWIILTFLFTCALHADVAQDQFNEGLAQLADGKFDQAAALFGKAIEANDEVAVYHLDRAVALMMLEKGGEANQELARANKLEPRNPDVRVWSHVRLLMFEPFTMGGSPPYDATDYAKQVIEAAIPYGTPHRPEEHTQAKAKLEKLATGFGWKQLGGIGAAATTKRVIALYEAQKYADCLALIDRVRAQGLLDATLTGYSAHCRLALGDVQVSRVEYTQSLYQFPVTLSWLVGRARCEIAVGSIRDAEQDMALARRIDPKVAALWLADLDKWMANARAKEVKDSAPILLASLKQAIADGKPDAELVSIASALARSRTSQRYIADEEYTREHCRLQVEINFDPQNVDKIVALATFLIEPTVVRKVAIEHVDATARIGVGQPNLDRAAQLMAIASKLDPKRENVVTQNALLFYALHQPDKAIAWVNQAVEAGVLNLDLCLIHLDYYTAVAAQLASQATALRTPRSWSETHTEGNQLVTTTHMHNPTPEELAQANELAKQADAFRKKAHVPLATLAVRLKDSTDAHGQIVYCLLNAHHHEWVGDYASAIAAAQGALKIDPYDWDALNFLIELCPKVNQAALAIQYQDLKNNMANPSAGRTLEKIWPQLRQTRFSGATEALDAAEKVDPSSVDVAASRFSIAENHGKLNEALPAARLIESLEAARVQLGGRSLEGKSVATLSASDVALTVYIATHIGQMLDDAGRVKEAIEQYNKAIAAASRVPVKEWTVIQPSTALSMNERDTGVTLASLLSIAHRQRAYKLLAQKNNKDALADVFGLVQLGDNSQTSLNIGYQIYHGIGWGPMAGHVPDGWQPMFEMMDHQRQNAAQFNRDSGVASDAEIGGIDARINKIEREIQHGVGPDELSQLTAERDQLLAKKQAIVQQRGGK